MKIIKPSVEYLGKVPTDYAGTLKFIEMAGRTCYKSEDKITEDSAEKFVRKLINAGHLAMVEHSNFVVRTRRMDFPLNQLKGRVGKYLTAIDIIDYTYVGGNLTAWFQRCMSEGIKDMFLAFANVYGSLFEIPNSIDLGWPDGRDWQICSHEEIPHELHRHSIKFICDRGVSHELVRHRPCSFAQESTRYVNYGGKDMEFIEPTRFEDWPERAKDIFAATCTDTMENYHQLIYNNKLKPQQARAVLPNALKTEIIVTADAAEWNHIKKLRTSPAAQPDMQRVMNMIPWEDII